MVQLEALRRQIASVEELGSVVRTMKSMAAVHVRRYERAARSLARFDETVELGFQVLLRHVPLEELLPLARAGRGRRRVAAIVLGTDQGMCGPFSDRIVAFARGHVAELGGAHARGPVLAVGHRAADLLEDTELVPDDVLAAPSSPPAVTSLVQELLVRIEAWREAGRFERLLVFHNRRAGTSLAKPHVRQHLPLPEDWLRELAHRPWTGPSLPAFTLEPETLLTRLVGQVLFGALYRAVVESLESESFSRLTAMQAAETNIADLLEELQGSYRRERQASILAELLDIVSGYETTLDDERAGGRSRPARTPGARARHRARRTD